MVVPHPLPGPLEDLSCGREDAGCDPVEEAGKQGQLEWKPESLLPARWAHSTRRTLLATSARHETRSPRLALCPTE